MSDQNFLGVLRPPGGKCLSKFSRRLMRHENRSFDRRFIINHFRTWLNVLLVGLLLLSAVAVGQNFADYAKPAGHFPNPLRPYVARDVPPPRFGNTTRIEDVLKDGKLRLSLSDAVALALENNLDLAIARFNLSIADTDLLRAKSGQSVRGVATGLVQGTPGGGVGGFGTGAPGAGAGGTSGGAGGAGTGASGLVQSTLGAGSAVGSYDPEITSLLAIEHSASPLSNTVTTGVPNFLQNTVTGNFSFTQAFPTGTSLSMSFQNDRVTSNSIHTSLLPQIDSYTRLSLTQHLLQGFGTAP